MGTRRSLAVVLGLAAVLCAVSAVGPLAARRAAQRRTGRAGVALPNRDGSLKFAVLGDFGTGERTAVPARRADGEAARRVSRSSWYHRRRQHLRRRAAAGHAEKFEEPYKALLDAG